MHCIFYYTYYLYSNISSSPTSTTFALLLLHYCDYSWYLFHHHTPGAGPAPSYCSYYSFRKFLLLLLRLLLLYLWHNLSLIMCDSVRRMRARTFSDAFFHPPSFKLNDRHHRRVKYQMSYYWMSSIIVCVFQKIRWHCARQMYRPASVPFPKTAFFGGVAEILSSKDLLTFFGTLP